MVEALVSGEEGIGCYHGVRANQEVGQQARPCAAGLAVLLPAQTGFVCDCVVDGGKPHFKVSKRGVQLGLANKIRNEFSIDNGADDYRTSGAGDAEPFCRLMPMDWVISKEIYQYIRI